MQIDERWLAALAKLQTKFPEAVIAGGALRDTYNGKFVKDIDVFVKARGIQTKALIEEALGREVETLNPDMMTEYEEHFGELFAVFDCGPTFRPPPSDDDEFNIFGEYGPPLQIIALNMDVTLQSVVSRFDFGICKIAHNGAELFIHPDFTHDVEAKTFTLRLGADAEERRRRAMLRWDRLSEKYAGWAASFP